MIARWLFLGLLILNAGYFLYQKQFAEEFEAEADPQLVEGSERTIVLLSEAIADGSARKIVVREEVDPFSVDKPVMCTKISGFKEAEDADQVQQRLMASGIGSNVQKAKVSEASKFWVYIGPLPDRNSAMQEFKRLRLSGVDSYLISDGDLRNAVSLGIFSRKVLATRLLEKHKSHGEDVRIKEVPKFKYEYQIHINREDRDLFSQELWEGVKNRYEFAEKHDNLCEDGVASRP